MPRIKSHPSRTGRSCFPLYRQGQNSAPKPNPEPNALHTPETNHQHYILTPNFNELSVLFPSTLPPSLLLAGFEARGCIACRCRCRATASAAASALRRHCPCSLTARRRTMAATGSSSCPLPSPAFIISSTTAAATSVVCSRRSLGPAAAQRRS